MDVLSAGTFDPTQYPRTYAATIGWSAFSILSSLLAMGLFGFLAWKVGTEESAKLAMSSQFILRAALLAGIGYIMLNIVDTFRFRLVLSSDSIEIRRLWGTRRLLRSDVAGWKHATRRRGSTYRKIDICSRRNAHARPFGIPLVFKLDAQFVTWFADIPALNLGATFPKS